MTRSSQRNVHVSPRVQLPADPIADEATRPLDKMLRPRTLRKEQQLQNERQRRSWTQTVDRSDIVPCGVRAADSDGLLYSVTQSSLAPASGLIT